MATLKQMCEAGMLLTMMENTVKTNESIDFDTRIYLADKLNDAFFNVQAEISLAISSSLDIMGEENDD